MGQLTAENRGLFLLSQSLLWHLTRSKSIPLVRMELRKLRMLEGHKPQLRSRARPRHKQPLPPPLPPSPPFPAARLWTPAGAAKDARWEKNNTPDPWLHEGKQSPLPLLPGRAAESWINTAELLWLLVLAVLHTRLPGLLTGIGLQRRARACGKAGLGWGLINNNSPSAHCIDVHWIHFPKK